MSDDKSIRVVGDQVKVASVLALRGALRLETRGMKKKGRSARVIANEYTGSNARTAKEAYEALNAYVVKLGGKDWPLS